jgi:hypothetical protein
MSVVREISCNGSVPVTYVVEEVPISEFRLVGPSSVSEFWSNLLDLNFHSSDYEEVTVSWVATPCIFGESLTFEGTFCLHL